MAAILKEGQVGDLLKSYLTSGSFSFRKTRHKEMRSSDVMGNIGVMSRQREVNDLGCGPRPALFSYVRNRTLAGSTGFSSVVPKCSNRGPFNDPPRPYRFSDAEAMCRKAAIPIQTCQCEKIPEIANSPAIPKSDASLQTPST